MRCLSSFVVAKLKAEAAEVELVAELESTQMVSGNTSHPVCNLNKTAIFDCSFTMGKKRSNKRTKAAIN